MSHVTENCPLTVVNCDFKGFGCEVRLRRKDLHAHLIEGLVSHMSLQTKRLMCLEEENKKLKQEVKKLTEDLKTHDNCINASQSMDLSMSVISRFQQQLARDLNAYQISTPLCPVEFTMMNFEQHKKDCDEWYSPPFYTYPYGYKLCLWVFAGGHRGGANTHVSSFFMLMKGEYDNQLKWLFQGRFTIQLLNQQGGEECCHMTVDFDYCTPNEYCKRIVDKERSGLGGGKPRFICHTDLHPKYLQNDCLKFCIKKLD